VQRFFLRRHPNHYKVYNLCSERDYEADKFGGMVERFPIDDHEACEFKRLLLICKSVHAWLSEHAQNVAAFHCYTGKGRTALVICCYLLYAKLCPTASAALDLFNSRRTVDGSDVAMPSQRRYVGYFERWLHADQSVAEAKLLPEPLSKMVPPTPEQVKGEALVALQLVSIAIHGIPSAIRSSSVNVWFVLSRPGSESFKYSSRKTVRPIRYLDAANAIVFTLPLDRQVLLAEDVRCQFFYGSTIFKRELLRFWFNARFIGWDPRSPNTTCRLVIPHDEWDGTHNDSVIRVDSDNAYIEVAFRPHTGPMPSKSDPDGEISD
jgi:protein-tyrosine phosphatase